MLFRLEFLEEIFLLVCSSRKHPSGDSSISNTLQCHSQHLERIGRASPVCFQPLASERHLPLLSPWESRAIHLVWQQISVLCTLFFSRPPNCTSVLPVSAGRLRSPGGPGHGFHRAGPALVFISSTPLVKWVISYLLTLLRRNQANFPPLNLADLSVIGKGLFIPWLHQFTPPIGDDCEIPHLLVESKIVCYSPIPSRWEMKESENLFRCPVQ